MKFISPFLLIQVFVLLAGPLTGYTLENDDDGEKKTDVQALPLDELKTFTQVFIKIKNDYVQEVDDRELLENAIRGMLEGLDPHSSYLDKSAYKDLQEGTSGEFGGLGIEVGMEDGFVKVISPIDNTPAEKAGIESGDLIIRLDDVPVKGMALNDAVKSMRGKPGTDISLTIVRNGLDAPLKIIITRAIIKVTSVRSRTLEPGLGYLRISQFQAHTGEDMRQQLEELKAENKDGLNGLILDLRNNPGGVLSAAVSVSDLFLEKGLIVYTEGRIKDSKMQFSAKPADVISRAPLIVLVNGGSASASEIVAGALQDHNRAIIMGEKTFGKGSVQTILPLETESALKLTTARYYTPSGRSIQASGIIPDIIIDKVKIEILDTPDNSIKEANLARHLENDTNVADSENSDKDTAAEKQKDKTPLAKRDYALYEALNVLKGLIILKKQS
jgi:carboxyl-terminal processing protease